MALDYADAQTQEIEVVVGEARRPALLLTPNSETDPTILMLFAECDCGEEECAGILMLYTVKLAPKIADVTFGDEVGGIHFTATRTSAREMVVDDADAVLRSVVAEDPEAGYDETGEAIEGYEQIATGHTADLFRAVYDNAEFMAWRARVDPENA